MFRQKLSSLTIILILLISSIFLTGCLSNNNSPRSIVQHFVSNLSKGKYAAAANLTDNPTSALASLTKSFEGISPDKFKFHVGKADIGEESAKVAANYEWQIGKESWSYPLGIDLVKQLNKWAIKWSNSVIHPQLSDNQSLSRIPLESDYAPIVDANGVQLLVPGNWYNVFFSAKDYRDIKQQVADLEKIFFILKPFLGQQTVQSVSEQVTSGKKEKHLLAKLKDTDYNIYKNALLDIPGVSVERIIDLFPVNKDADLTYLNRIKTANLARLKGIDGWEVAMVNEFGKPIQTLFDNPAKAAPVMKVSLVSPIQLAAERAVGTRNDKAAMLVAIQPSSGRILAIAHNHLARQQGLLAGSGLYPPGSTFKIITAAAAIENKMATVGTIVPCPGQINIATRVIPNYGHFSLGNVTMNSAFANSCNTTFAKLSSQMPPQLLHDTGYSLSLGKDYQVPGITTNTGEIPVVNDPVKQAEDGFGQGTTLASVLGMALVAANVKQGREVIPQFILNHAAKPIANSKLAIHGATFNDLKYMMRSVVTSGTGIAINGMPDVYGKTGEAEYAGGSHAWFVGFKDDMAFAVLIVDGGGSESAVAMTKTFFENF